MPDPKKTFLIASAPFLVALVWFASAFPRPAFCDRILTEDGKEYVGAITDKNTDQLSMQTNDGMIQLWKTDISDISYDPELVNLLFLAGYYQSQKEPGRAYHLYKKAFMLDPGSEEAQQGLSSLDKYSLGDTEDPDEKEGFVSNYENFAGSAGEETDSDSLARNTELTQKLLDEFGLVLEVTASETVIRQVVDNKKARAFKAGLKNSDIIVSMNGSSSAYLGYYGAIAELLNKKNSKIKLEIIRHVNLWVADNRDINFQSLTSTLGFDLSEKNNELIVSVIQPKSYIENFGVKSGDSVVFLDDLSALNLSKADFLKAVYSNSPKNVDISFKKVIYM